MKEKEITQSQAELTTKPVNPTLEVRGDIFMPEPGGGEVAPTQDPVLKSEREAAREVTDEQVNNARRAWALSNEDTLIRGEKITRAERETQEILIKEGLMPIRGGSGDVPEEENKENLSQEEKKQRDWIDSAEDFESALKELIDNASDEGLREAARKTGEELINFLTEGLPRESSEKYINLARELRDLGPREIRLRFGDIIKNINDERKAAGLDDPGVRQAKEEHEKNLSEELKDELKNINTSSDQEEAGSGGGGDKKPPSPPTGSSPEEPHRDEPSDEEKSGRESGEIQDEKLKDILRLLGGLKGDEETRENTINDILSNSDLQGIISDVSRDRNTFIQSLSALKNILENPDPEAATEGVRRFLENIDGKFRSGLKREEEYGEKIESIQALAKWIAKKQSHELWGEGGVYPILNADESINRENFLIWVREQSIKLHEDNQNDEMYPLSAVGIETTYRNISIYMMTRFRDQYFKNAKDGKVLDSLASEVLNEAFGFGVIRNSHLFYRRVMRQDTELPKALAQLHGRNDITRWNALETIYSMPASFGEKGDTQVGKGIQLANDIYYNLSDKEELKDVLGEDGVFTKDDFTDAIKIIQNKKDWEEIENYEDIYKDGNFTDGLFDEKGKINMEYFVKKMNFYAFPTEKISTVNLVRELIRVKISQKHGLSAGIGFSKEEKDTRKKEWEQIRNSDGEEEANRTFFANRYADRINLKFAETTSFEMQRPYGIAARNDVNRFGYDAATKLYLEDYLLRQSGENTAGPVGVPEAIGIFRMLSPDMWVGLRTESGDSPYEIFKRLRNIENSDKDVEKKEEERKEELKKLRFRQDAELDFASNQEMRAFTILHTMSGGEQLDLNKIVSYSFLEGVKYNPKEFEEQIKEKFIKPMRYAFSSNAGLKYSSMVRRLTNSSEILKGDGVAPIYEDVRLAEAMFSPEVLEGIDPNSYDERETRTRIMKNAARARIAAELRYHRKFGSVGETWNYHRTETFLDALQTLEAYEKDSDRPGRVVKSGEKFFSEDDIKWIRKNSGSEVWRMLMVDAVKEGGPALAGGTWEGFTKFLQSLF